MLSDETKRYLTGLEMSKRARAALDIMIAEGAVTTLELRERHGLEHAPRAIRDLKDAGAAVTSNMVTIDGKRMSRYQLEDIMAPGSGSSPRNPITKVDRDRIIAEFDGRCAVCGSEFARLQLDHRVPFAIAGDPERWSAETGMPLCASDNRAKSWACEHCSNWVKKDPAMCAACMWCRPENYEHIAGESARRLVVTATTDEGVELLRDTETEAVDRGISPSEVVLDVLHQRSRLPNSE